MKTYLIPRQLKLYVLCLCLLVLLSGCAYPKELRQENKINPGEFITVVQQAIDKFHEKTGVLPIKNSDMSTPLYEKYVVDFGKLQKMNYLSSVPANAFEKGGIFMYVLVNAETKPEVKLIDLSAFQSVADVQAKVDAYKVKHNGQLPAGIAIDEAFDYVDFEKLGMKSPEIKSAFNRQSYVNYMLDKVSGTVAIDYAPDIMKLIQDKAMQNSLAPEQDLRDLLVASSYFVPAKSYPYYWKDNQPLPSDN